MRLVFLADGRSPIARNWIAYFLQAGYEVHLLTTRPCEPLPGLESLHLVPVAFGGRGGAGGGGARGTRLRTLVRDWLGPVTVPGAARQVRALLARLRPDLVHAMRLPFEGVLAAWADPPAPLVLSVWGNDFTLHARLSPPLALLTRRALARADALHADCHRDLRLARRLGFPEGRPAVVLPGNGGVRRDIFCGADGPVPEEGGLAYTLRSLPAGAPVLVNPRGFRAYVRNETFFRALPLLRQRFPDLQVLCPAMAGEAEAVRWLARLGLRSGVHLLPALPPEGMAAVFRRAWVSVSPSEHDGTPNTLLEAMACGAFPVAGDLESIREWIEDGVNGLLVDPRDPQALAAAVVQALEDEDLRARAREANARIIDTRARYEVVMAQAEALYRQVAGAGQSPSR